MTKRSCHLQRAGARAGTPSSTSRPPSGWGAPRRFSPFWS